MRRYPRKLVRYAALAVAFSVCTAALASPVETSGLLRLTVVSKTTGQPFSGAKIILRDTANEKPDVEIQTDDQGSVISPQLDARDWEVRIESGGAVLLSQVVTVVADTVTDLSVAAEAPSAPGAPAEPAAVTLLRKAQTVVSALRTKRFADLFPVGAGNPFSLENLLKTVPGFTSGALGQLFARGDQNPGTIYINGVKLPDMLAGQLGQTVGANLISSLDAMTGGLPAQYGSMASSVVNINLKGGTLQPKNAINAFGGTFATFDGQVVVSGQTGRQVGTPDSSGRVQRNLGYFLNLSGRQTDNNTQSPQPDDQEANNKGRYSSVFGNFDYRPSEKDSYNILFNHQPLKSHVANRTGLGSRWPTGGLGFGGYFGNRDNRGDGGMLSQEELGIDQFQESVSTFGFVTWRRKPDENTDWMLSFGSSRMDNDMSNDNPPIGTNPFLRGRKGGTSSWDRSPGGSNLTRGGSPPQLPYNSSQEFNQTIRRNNKSFQGQGEFHRKTGSHDVRFGFFFDHQDGRESYNMASGSQLALNALFTADPQLAPPGFQNFTEGPNGEKIPVLDELGNFVYTATGSSIPTVRTDLTRQNRSFFLQDDWRPSSRFSMNFGARWDSYRGEQNRGMDDAEDDMVSPRVNLAYQYDHRTMLRLSYNRLFQAPPLVQGMVIGANPKVAVADQLDFSFERSLGPTSSMKLTGFHKDTDDQVYLRQLVEGLQDGPLAGVNLDNVKTKGIELSLQLTPVNGRGLSGFLNWTNSVSKPHGMASDGSPAPDFMPTDQRNTINAGMNYLWANGASWGFSWELGSGLPGSDLFGDDQRRGRSFANFRFQTAPNALGFFGGVTVDVQNVFDSRTVINFNSPVDGTRFSQGRRITISAFSQFLTR